jgi:hypothetical protein
VRFCYAVFLYWHFFLCFMVYVWLILIQLWRRYLSLPHKLTLTTRNAQWEWPYSTMQHRPLLVMLFSLLGDTMEALHLNKTLTYNTNELVTNQNPTDRYKFSRINQHCYMKLPNRKINPHVIAFFTWENKTSSQTIQQYDR